MKYLHFIVNPISGGGKHNLTASVIRNHFERSKFYIEVDYSKHKGHAKALARHLVTQNPDVIIACGGDGTINEIASALVGTGIALGIVPVGSGNGLAAHLKIPKRPEDAFAIIRSGNLQVIDVGKVNDCYFFSNMGVGIDAEIIKRYERSGARKLYSYVKAALAASWSFSPKPMDVFIDGSKRAFKPYMLFVSNSNEMGYAMSLTPDASLSDGKLDLFLVDLIPLLTQLDLGMKILQKRVETFGKAERATLTELSVEVPHANGINAQIDGEFKRFDTHRLDIAVLPHALQVLTPS